MTAGQVRVVRTALRRHRGALEVFLHRAIAQTFVKTWQRGAARVAHR